MSKKFLIMGVILITLAVGFFIINQINENSLTGKATEEEFCIGEECSLYDIQEFNIEAFKFEYSPNIIKVKQGERVRININNLDTVHGITIPDLGINGKDTIKFIAEEKGEFTWYCNNYCGGGHAGMSGKLIVE